MLHYQLLNVEQAFHLLEFCVFADRPKMAAFLDEVIDILHIIEDVVSLADIHNLFAKLTDLAHVLMASAFHVSQFW